MKRQFYLYITLLLVSCKNEPSFNIFESNERLEAITGTSEYLNSPFLSAGNSLYVVGHQNGSFPHLGFHIKDEMGGVWMHPIKLLDGYHATISAEGIRECLTTADEFINYPILSQQNFSVNKIGIRASQIHFVPQNERGLIVAYQFENTTDSKQELNFTFHAAIDLRPTWLSDSLGITDGDDEVKWNRKKNGYLAKDTKNKWFATVGGKGLAPIEEESTCMPSKLESAIGKSLTMKAGEKKVIYVVIAGSDKSEKAAWETYEEVQSNMQELYAEKAEIYTDLTENNRLATRDDKFDQMFRWMKYNAEWLMQNVPEFGSGLTAGSPDYPWWFGTDNGYAVQGLLAAGMHAQALETIDLIFKLSKRENGNSGKIIHEASTNGVVYNPGNLNTTPKFISMLWKAYAWTGKQSILDKYYESVKASVKWIEAQDKNGNGFPDGAGMMEIHRLDSEMIDVVAYQYEMYLAAANFAKVKNDKVLAGEYEAKAASLKSKINSDWWVANFNSYADFRSTQPQAVQLLKDAIIRADTIDKPWSVEELRLSLAQLESQNISGTTPYVVHHNWIVNTPMEVGAADADKAQLALKTAEKYRNRFGMFVTGIDRDEQQEKASKWKSFSYVGAVMTLPTGVQAIAEANYGNPDRALDYLKMLESSFSYALPGSMYEVSPDFGMMTQAWNIYSVAVPVVEHFFGIRPRAWKNEIVIKPNLPFEWSDVSLQKIKVGNNHLDLSAKRIGNALEFNVTQTQNWNLIFEFPNAKKIIHNGRVVQGKSLAIYGRIHKVKVEM